MRIPHTRSSPHSLQLEENPCNNEDPAQPKIKMNKINKLPFLNTQYAPVIGLDAN